MTAQWLLANLAAYSVQFAVLFGGVAVAVRVLRPAPRVSLGIWEGVFLLACQLPLWSAPLAFFRLGHPAGASDVLSSVSAASLPNSGSGMDWAMVATVGVVSVTVARLVRLGLGLIRIRRWRRDARQYETAASMPVTLDVRISSAVHSPMTVGLFRPVVLVPDNFCTQPEEVKRAVICHEAEHVRRRDPLRILAVEIWRACLWFNPAAGALAARLDLAREVRLDQLAIRACGDRRAYARALMVFSSSGPAAPAAAFNRRSHLAQRIEAIAHQEVPVSALRSSVIAAVCGFVMLASGIGGAAVIPMKLGRASVQAPAAPYQPGNGVSLPRVIHEVKAEYPPAALKAKIEGAVFLSAVAEVDGSAGRIAIVRSLDAEYGIDQAAMDALAQWRFEPGQKDGQAVPVEIEIEMRFRLK